MLNDFIRDKTSDYERIELASFQKFSYGAGLISYSCPLLVSFSPIVRNMHFLAAKVSPRLVSPYLVSRTNIPNNREYHQYSRLFSCIVLVCNLFATFKKTSSISFLPVGHFGMRLFPACIQVLISVLLRHSLMAAKLVRRFHWT